MYITEIKCKKSSGKVFKTVLLRKSYREGGKVKNKTVANLSSCTEEEVNVFKMLLKHKDKAFQVGGSVEIIPGKSLGSVFVLYEVAKRIGIVEALGSSFHGKLALWLIIARIIEQGSRLSATRLDSTYDIASVIGLERGFDENNLYDSLHWVDKHQNNIEDKLFKRKSGAQKFYWYDVTSSYFEGQCNEFAAFGYNRDKKTQKRIIVIGLLCQNEGDPVSIEAFKGNTQDTQTFENQLQKLKNRFGCEAVTIVSDRGLIREKQKGLLADYNFHYITALPMPQITPLLKKEILKVEDFTTDLKSFQHEDKRYIYRRNPERALETQIHREDRLKTVKEKIAKENEKLRTSPKASLPAATKRIQGSLKKYYLAEWMKLSLVQREFVLTIDQEKLKEKSAFDGCYVWTTDWKESELSNEEVYQNYKNLKYVEDDFRSFKSSFLEIRPIFVRTAESTKGHLLIVMLAHMILRELRKAWGQFDKTVQEALTELSLLCRNDILIGDAPKISCIATPNTQMEALLKAVNVRIPTSLDKTQVPVVSRQKTKKSVKN